MKTDEGSASADRSVRERAANLLRMLVEQGAWRDNGDFLREVVRGLASAITQTNPDDEAHALEQLAHRARRAVLAEVRHDLLTPLNGILGYAQLLARDPTLNARQHDAVQTVHDCGERLLHLITGHLDRAPRRPHAESAAADTESPNPTSDANSLGLEPALSEALRAALIEAASQGDIEEVNRGLDELERRASHPRLLAALRAHADGFDMSAIRARLQRTRGTSE